MKKIINFIIKEKWIFILFLLGIILRLIAIQIDPFLHPWDERFHALVARNMMDAPFTPILRVNPITDNYDPFIWCCNHIWLHKQPLFLWQMAISMKIFGVSLWSMRLPSAIMGALLILLIYRIIINMQFNRRIALLTAVMLTFSCFHLQLISGIQGMDHNDVAHGFYILASIWALTEYIKTKKWYWFVFIGVFSGAAILIKWLTGLFVYLIWGIYNLFLLLQKEKIKNLIVPFLLSLLVCLLIFGPWQLYILARWPELAQHEYEFNRRHITEILEQNGGDFLFYYEHFSSLIGKYIYYFIPLGIIASLFYKKGRNKLSIAVLLSISFAFIFFNFIVKTKIPTYIFFIVPFFLFYIALLIDFIIKWFPSIGAQKTLLILAGITLAYLSLNPKYFIEYLSPANTERANRIYNAEIYKNIREHIPDDVHVVLNMNSFEDIDVMFFNKGMTAYHWTLPQVDIEEMKEKKIKIAVFKEHGHYNIPSYLYEYPYIYIIDLDLKNFYE